MEITLEYCSQQLTSKPVGLFFEDEVAAKHYGLDTVVYKLQASHVHLYSVQEEENPVDCPFPQDVGSTCRDARVFLDRTRNQDQLAA